MNLSEIYNECFIDEEFEKVAEAVIEEENEIENDLEKVAASYVEAGRQMARNDFAAMEAETIEELEKLGYVIEEEVDPKDAILERMHNDPEYAQALIEKHY